MSGEHKAEEYFEPGPWDERYAGEGKVWSGRPNPQLVAEVLTGLIDADPASYRSREPDWTPTLPARGERFGLIDLLLLS